MGADGIAVVRAVSGETATWTIPLQICIAIGQGSATAQAFVTSRQTSARKRALKETPLELEASDVIDATVLERPGFDLDTAVFLAEASSTAYSTSGEIDGWARSVGFQKSAFVSVMVGPPAIFLADPG